MAKQITCWEPCSEVRNRWLRDRARTHQRVDGQNRQLTLLNNPKSLINTSFTKKNQVPNIKGFLDEIRAIQTGIWILLCSSLTKYRSQICIRFRCPFFPRALQSNSGFFFLDSPDLTMLRKCSFLIYPNLLTQPKKIIDFFLQPILLLGLLGRLLGVIEIIWKNYENRYWTTMFRASKEN